MFRSILVISLASILLMGCDSGPGVDLGDDGSRWANDGECDDPRFTGPGMALGSQLAENAGHDATDCREAWDAGRLRLVEAEKEDWVVDGINFGDNSSAWSNDGECDDPRFQGSGMARSLVDDDVRSDANDCVRLYDAGQIEKR